MKINELNPNDAYQKILNEQAIYLDVRTTEEYEDGHAVNSYNIPIYISSNGGMASNQDFLATVQKHFKNDQLLVVGCRSGKRSMAACEVLAENGFQYLFNIEGGFYGNQNEGIQGWSQLNLPTENGQPVGRNYNTLKS